VRVELAVRRREKGESKSGPARGVRDVKRSLRLKRIDGYRGAEKGNIEALTSRIAVMPKVRWRRAEAVSVTL
jgi:hypothetical protein